MATAYKLLDDVIEKNPNHNIDVEISTFSKEMGNMSQESEGSNLSSKNTASFLSGDVDRWIHGSASLIQNTDVQGRRLDMEERSTIVNSIVLGCNNSFRYILAMLLPIFNIQHFANRRTNPSNFLSKAELFLQKLAGLCGLIRNQLRVIMQEDLPQYIFAGVMDFVLVMYAVGFLVLSMYQASIIG